MEKLIDLLNEFCREKRWDYVVVRYREKEHSFDTFVEWKVDYMTDLYVVSKRCGFIERLIDNDKIDVDKIKLWSNNSKDYVIYWWWNSIIIELALSDEPIEDLISLLK